MTAGLATLEVLFDQGGWDRLMAVSKRFRQGIVGALEATGLPVKYIQTDSLFWFSFDSEELPRTAASISKAGITRYAKFHRQLLEQGIYFAPSGYEVGFLNTALSDVDVDRAAGIVIETIKTSYTEN
jgi:glutamate-1-semialdehyde 2,1-aminomutase